MCHSSTGGIVRARGFLVVFALAATAAFGQGLELRLPATDWRPIGGTVFEASLASLATGPVERVWFDSTGERLYAATASGRVFETRDYERWQVADDVSPGDSTPVRIAGALPEPAAMARGREATLYAVGRAVHRSEDGGFAWANMTEYRGRSIIGDELADLAVSPGDENEIVVAGGHGVWRSVDGGLTWAGLNEGLPNLPARRLLALPGGGGGTRIAVDGRGAFEWAPGEKSAWQPADAAELGREYELKRQVSGLLDREVNSAAAAGDYLYAGAAGGGVLWASPDAGRTWRSFEADGAGSIEKIFVLPGNPRVALAAAGEGEGVHILRTTNGGLFWDDLTENLSDVPARSVTADPSTGAVYAATDGGVYFTVADLLGAGPGTPWIRVSEALPEAAAVDVRLDDAGNQLYVLLEGAGVYAATAPHRFLAPSIVNAADLRARAASPGVLLSVLGGRVITADAGALEAPILASSERESQIQVPFEAAGTALSLALTTAGASGAPQRFTLGLPLFEAAPAIFEDRDGTPMVLDADSGLLLDAMTPARPGSRIQILATGLGRVDPAWPTGMPAPLEDPPEVVAELRVMLDRAEIEVTRATLAPGYVGFYIVEFVVPSIVNAGPAELYIEAAGRASNRTRVYLEP